MARLVLHAMRRARIIAALLLLPATRALEEGKVCFNGCSGHGACSNFICTCDPGWHGDDCSHSLIGGNATVHTLTAGHFNVTAKNFSKLLKKFDVAVVAFGSRACLRCVGAEQAYAAAAPGLKALGVPLARADADVPFFRELLQELQLGSMPQVVAYRRSHAAPFTGAHAPDALVAFARKLKGEAAPRLTTLNAALRFLGVAEDARALKARLSLRAETGVVESDVNDTVPPNAARVLGLFADAAGVEADESAEFDTAASERRSRHDVYFARIDDEQVARALVDGGFADRTPSVLVANDDVVSHVLDDAPDVGLGPWVDAETLPGVGELTPQNFARYEVLNRPMLLLFLDLQGHDRNTELGGLSGGVPNRDLVEEFRQVRRDESFRDRVAFAYVDGVAQEDRMKSLGLFGGVRRLPAVAVNAKEDGVIAPFPESLPLDRAHLRDFLGAFLGRRLRSKEDADAFALQRKDDVFDPKWLPTRKPRKKAPREVMGRLEHFGVDSVRARQIGRVDDVKVLTPENFDEEALAEKDVCILFHAEGCEKCAALTVYYKKMAERFKALHIPSLVIARFDVTRATPPLDGLIAGPLPVIVLLPARDKRPPFRFYSGLGKVQPMMKWLQASSDIRFDLPELCHLDPSEIGAYKEQVTAREKRRQGEL